ncbi:MAG TPA: hypothetical protein VGO11_08915 [Chthoniobacteraceae bacterium]|jgi:hypothetical protein|nr:hypothetical protein [Chthoniobacteraceae bacterium]
MKTPFLSVLFAILCTVAHAQFYAPPVDFHDVAQRRFPVEAARVLAWQRKGTDPQITDVKYRVETDQAGQTVWFIEWRKKAGASRKATVRYPESALRGGAEWYREVWKQLAGKDWAAAKSAPGDVAAGFWEGAESAGITRLEGISAALARAAAEPAPSAAESARSAGALVQSAVPMVSTQMSIDGALLARSAAWLCAAEQQSGVQDGVLWAPLLNLAGREREAKTAWGNGPPGATAATPLGKCWHFMITLPHPRTALAEMARPENRLYAAPVFEAYGSSEPSHGKTLADLAKKLYTAKRWERLQDYGPELNFGTNLPVGPTLPLAGLRDWVAALRKLTPAAGDFAGLPEWAKRVTDFDTPKLPESPSPELSSLLNARMQEGEGPLIPVAVVTGRDLLVFGWELGGVQFGCLQGTYGPLATYGPKAGDLEKNWTGSIAGWEAFIYRPKFPPFEPLKEYDRLELIGWRNAAMKLSARPPAAWPNMPDAFLRRRWLGDTHRGLDYLVAHEGKPAEATRLLRRAIQEGGPGALGGLLVRDNLVTQDVLDRTPDWPELPEVSHELRQAVPMNALAGYREVAEQLAQEQDPWKRAQALERFHWASGLGHAPQVVFAEYVRANALQSAQRFYDRWKGTMTDRYTFQVTLGASAWTLAVLQGDEERMATARKDIGGTFDKNLEISAALVQGDVEGARKQMDKSLETMSPNANGRVEYEAMRAYLDLVPALLDLKHADHQKAVASFPETRYFLVLQWLLLTKAKLPNDEAAQFLKNGDDPERQLLLAALQGDKPRFQTLYDELTRESDARSRYWKDKSTKLYGPKGILFAWLRNRLFAVPAPKEEPDLMPPDAEPLLPLLRKIALEPLPGEKPARR